MPIFSHSFRTELLWRDYNESFLKLDFRQVGIGDNQFAWCGWRPISPAVGKPVGFYDLFLEHKHNAVYGHNRCGENVSQ